MPTWKLTIEYKGTKYRGWQEQSNARTVQGELHQAAEATLGKRPEIVGSGRTDAGVHALGQVAHLKINQTMPAGFLLQGLNDHLSADVNVRHAVPMNAPFHARHDAVERFYLYQIATRRTAFAKPYVWWVKDRLDANAMCSAAACLLGRHDFSTFSEKGKDPVSPVVEVTSCEIRKQGDLILFRIGASHFLWKMVRRLVGVLVEIGRGNLTPDAMEALLRSGSDAVAQWTAPPSGLFLEYVRYAGDPPPGPLSPAFFLR
jgi:tRNA pseudouridine38-40 synthase